MPTEAETPRTPWLDAWSDRLASLQTTSANLRFVDVRGDGDHRMLVGHVKANRLKVFQGTMLEADFALPDTPSAVGDFTPPSATNGASMSPVVAVACGSSVLLYRELRPYSKFAVPPTDLAPVELAAWAALQAHGASDVAAAVAALAAARAGGVRLSSRSQELLAIEDAATQALFGTSFENVPLQQEAVVTCMETLAVSGGVSCLVLGTESGGVLILNGAGTKVLCTVQLPDAPVAMSCAGEFAVEFSVFVACRDGKVYTVAAGEVQGQAVLKKGPPLVLGAPPVGLKALDKHSVVAATMDAQLHSFDKGGRAC
jgi:Bardet-Biedl syndrome 1 protein